MTAHYGNRRRSISYLTAQHCSRRRSISCVFSTSMSTCTLILAGLLAFSQGRNKDNSWISELGLLWQHWKYIEVFIFWCIWILRCAWGMFTASINATLCCVSSFNCKSFGNVWESKSAQSFLVSRLEAACAILPKYPQMAITSQAVFLCPWKNPLSDAKFGKPILYLTHWKQATDYSSLAFCRFVLCSAVSQRGSLGLSIFTAKLRGARGFRQKGIELEVPYFYVTAVHFKNLTARRI